MTLWVETSGENPALARAEVEAVAAILGGGKSDTPPRCLMPKGFLPVSLATGQEKTLAARLALSYRCLVECPGDVEDWLEAQGAAGASASFRWLPDGGGAEEERTRWVAAYRRGGGSLNLRHPTRQFWIAHDPERRPTLLEEIATIDRRAFSERRMMHLPFRRPVTLPPRLARAAVNLAQVRPDDLVVDPFLGTGALLLESGLVGARIAGADRDADMVRGALRNLAHFGLTAEGLTVSDSAEAARSLVPNEAVDALVTDPPYGRASSTGGEAPESVLRRTLHAWSP
ncbi:MAG TPA: hypothetical protein VJS68_02385, partial [Thermoplasmata archaeon]|nr:hypothetical protein [Thermoplasmata archaeon]